MIINHNKTKLTKVSEINVPASFFSRMATGISQLDTLYGGEGILPGSVSTIAAAPGSGKTTLLLQLCESLSNNGYKTAYITGEESVEMIAYTCKRLNISNVYVASETDIDRLISFMEDMDYVVFDSFPTLSENGARLNRTGQDAAIGRIVSACKQHETAMCIILHITKNGMYKGSTTIPHAVDINMDISIDEDDTSFRTITTTKNRYGSLAEVSMYFGYGGFDFDRKVEPKSSTSIPKAKRKDEEFEKIKALQEPPGITIARVCKELNIDATRAGYLLRALVQDGTLVKFGRGDTAIWKHANYENTVAIK
jgi:predicted ATP-dependent serine protease